MQDMYNLKMFEIQKINEGIMSCRNTLVNSFSEAGRNEILEKIKLLESKKEKLNEELIDSEDLSELIKIKYALLLTNYATHQANKTSTNQKKDKNFLKKILDFNKK